MTTTLNIDIYDTTENRNKTLINYEV